jgi:ornithine cyclodeaminase/alanine dehydrogenase-like protein (mu-crystallin family)
MLFLSDADTQRILTWPDVIACLANVYSQNIPQDAAPPRVVARMDAAWLRALTAMSSTRKHMGAKIIGRSRRANVSYLIALWEQESSELVCLLDGKTVTAMRTAGTSAVAMDRMLKKEAVRVAVLGSGHEASTHAEALAAIRPIQSLTVYSPTAANREKFAREFSSRHHVECVAADSAEAAVRDADLVIAAARSHNETPILYGAWLTPGTLVVSIGSTLPEQIEIAPSVIERAATIIADVPEEVAHQTGDMLAARKAGVKFDHKLMMLSEFIQQKQMGSDKSSNITLFKSVGSGLQDIAVSEMCYEKALKLGVGAQLPLELAIKGPAKK